MTRSSRSWSPGRVPRRILFSTWPAHGHLLPLLPLARAAERAGHEVIIASGPEGAAEARRRGFTVWDVGPSRREAEERFRASAPSAPEAMTTSWSARWAARASGSIGRRCPCAGQVENRTREVMPPWDHGRRGRS